MVFENSHPREQQMDFRREQPGQRRNRPAAHERDERCQRDQAARREHGDEGDRRAPGPAPGRPCCHTGSVTGRIPAVPDALHDRLSAKIAVAVHPVRWHDTPTCYRFTVHNGVGYLCKTAPSLCTQRGNTEDSIGALFLYGTLTWENAVRALCIDGEPELSTRHAATANK